jgi:asparagine synthase (glutamine-hydrolysing)
LFSQEQYLFSDKELQSLLLETPNESDLLQHYFTTKRALNPAEEQALFDIHYYLKDDLLTKVDRASMQFSLETRTPFLDYRLVEFALNLPYEFKVQKGISKYILKEVLYDFIPASYFDRPKWGFSIPMDKWLKTDLRPMVDKYLSKELVTKDILHELYADREDELNGFTSAQVIIDDNLEVSKTSNICRPQ